MRDFRPWDESNIFRGYCVVFRFSLELLGQASPLVRFRISFSWISLSRMAASIGSMGVLGHVSATNTIVISFICGHAGDPFFDIIYKIIVCCCFI